MPQRVLILSNAAWNLYNFRLPLMRALRDRGHEVVALAPGDEYVSRIEGDGFSFVPVDVSRSGTNPVAEVATILRLWRLFKLTAPDIILTYTPKPNIYGSLAARGLDIPVINNVAGLGMAFVQPGRLAALVSQLYRVAFKRSHRVYFQNAEDMRFFQQHGLVAKTVCRRIPGSGVDIQRFSPRPRLGDPDTFVFMLVARMLWDKGIGEFIEAARNLKRRYPHAQCRLVGFLDSQNPMGIAREQIDAWVREGAVIYDGGTDNICEHMARADCIVLPSYREGVPRVLLEAASMAKPIVTTDSIGCKDAVDHGVTGYLCRARDAGSLFAEMERMLNLSDGTRAHMGRQGREKMIREFDQRLVIECYLKDIENRENC